MKSHNTFGTRHSSGFSMPELLLVIGIIGVISALSYPFVRGFNTANTHAEAQAKADALTAAKILFYRTDPIAAEKWQATAAPFELVKPYLYTTDDSLSLSEYAAAAPYDSFDFGSGVLDPVSVVDGETSTASVGDDPGTSEGHGNNGHGNNDDGVDVSNPEQGQGGPSGEDDPSGAVDDESGGGSSNGNGNANGSINQ